MRNTLTYYGDSSRTFTRRLLKKALERVDDTYWSKNPGFQGTEIRTDTIITRDSIKKYIQNLSKRKKGELPQEEKKLLDKLGKLDYDSLYEAINMYKTWKNPRRHTHEIIQRLQQGKLCDEDVEKNENYIAGLKINHILKDFVELRGVYIPKENEGYTFTLNNDGSQEFCLARVLYSERINVSPNMDNVFLDKLIASIGKEKLVPRELAKKLEKVRLPEHVGLGEYYLVGNSPLSIKVAGDCFTYFLVAITKPPKVVPQKEGLKQRVIQMLEDEDLMCAISLQTIAKYMSTNARDLVDPLVELAKEKRIKAKVENDQLIFHSADKSDNTLRDIFMGIS